MNDPNGELAELERAIKESRDGRYVLKLYITGSSTRSATAVSNVQQICEEFLAGRYDLEIVDVLQQPELAMEVQLLAAPTLIKEQPMPIRRLVGDMSDEDRVLYSLNIVRSVP